MIKFTFRIEKDGQIVDSVSAEYADNVLDMIQGACESLGLLDASDAPVTGPRSISYATRLYLTQIAANYGSRLVSTNAISQFNEQFKNAVSNPVITEG